MEHWSDSMAAAGESKAGVGTIHAVGFKAATGRPDCLHVRTGVFAR